MEKLPEDFKKKWIAALRSGEYKQGKDNLYNADADCFCCLGVAGLVCGAEKAMMNKATLFGAVEPNYEIQPPVELPPLLVHQTDHDVSEILSEMNDSGKSFSEIADYIEENL